MDAGDDAATTGTEAGPAAVAPGGATAPAAPAASAPGAPEPVGFVGLGSIGRPMVESLLRAGIPAVVNDLDPAAVDAVVAQGATAAATLAELAAAADVVGVCVPADEHVRTVLDGPDGLLAHLRAGAVVAIHSTVLPETVLWARDAAAPGGVAVVEAAVTGGFLAAAEGRSTFLLGGEPADLERIGPLVEACGAATVHAGDLGSASRLKLCVNLQTYATFSGVFEAATLVRRLGLPLDALKDVMRANGQLSEAVDAYLLLHQLDDATLADPSMQDRLEGFAAIIGKDLHLIQQLADQAGVDVPVAELAGRQARRTYFLEVPPDAR